MVVADLHVLQDADRVRCEHPHPEVRREQVAGDTLLVDAAELDKRRAALPPATTPEWARRGYAHLFNQTILQADEGCDFDFMRGADKR